LRRRDRQQQQHQHPNILYSNDSATVFAHVSITERRFVEKPLTPSSGAAMGLVTWKVCLAQALFVKNEENENYPFIPK